MRTKSRPSFHVASLFICCVCMCVFVCVCELVLNFRIVLHFYYSVSAVSNRLKYLPVLILVVGKAVPLADINKVPLKYSP